MKKKRPINRGDGASWTPTPPPSSRLVVGSTVATCGDGAFFSGAHGRTNGRTERPNDRTTDRPINKLLGRRSATCCLPPLPKAVAVAETFCLPRPLSCLSFCLSACLSACQFFASPSFLFDAGRHQRRCRIMIKLKLELRTLLNANE